MQKTLFEFCASQRRENDTENRCSSSTVSSLGLESSSVLEDTGTNTQSSTAESEASEDPITCVGACCHGQDGPNQPRTRDVLEATTKSINGQRRSVSASWFDRYTSLTLCETRNVLLCHFCVEADRRRLITFSTKGDDAFVKSGFSRWKKALECFAKHEASSTHKEAVLKIKAAGSVNIGAILNARLKEQQQLRQRALQKNLCCVRYLARQGLALRGHDEKEGNMMQLLQMWSFHDADINEWLREGKYLSHEIINEQIKLMGDHVLREILSEIKSCMFYAIQADEATDVACNEQMCVSIRWVSQEYEIVEEPIGLVQMPKTDAATIFAALKDVLQRCILSVNSCRGQAYMTEQLSCLAVCVV